MKTVGRPRSCHYVKCDSTSVLHPSKILVASNGNDLYSRPFKLNNPTLESALLAESIYQQSHGGDMRLIAILLVALTFSACGGSGGGNRNNNPPPPPANNAPTASDVSALTRPATAVTGTLSATDADGDALTFALVAGPANGAVTFSGAGDQDFEYTPNAGFAGVDTFTFNASDGTDTSNAATATMTVNTPPSAAAASYTTSDIGTASGIFGASDADGDSVMFAVSSAPMKGTVTSLDAGTGEFVYTPDPTQDGLDSFAVTASDAAETSAPAVIDIEIFDWVGTQQFGSAARDGLITGGLIINPDGSQVQAGFTEGQVESNPNAGAQDVFLRSTDRRGNQTSISQFGGADDDVARVLFPRPQGDGYYLVASGPDDNIYRYNTDGTEVFSVPLPVSGVLDVAAPAYWGAVDQDGDVYVITWAFGANRQALSGLVSKVNGADGTLVWQRQLLTSIEDAVDFFIADTNRISPRGIDFDSTGNPVVSGEYWDTSSTRPCSVCGFITKLDGNTGTDIWLREPDAFASCGADGSGRFYRLTAAPDDTLYLTGAANIDVFPGTDGLVARYSANGSEELWSFCDNSGADTTSYFTNPLITRDGGIIIYGNVGDATSPPDPDNGGPSASDLFVYKFASDGNITWTRQIEATRADGSDAGLGAGAVAEDSQGILYITGSTDGELTGAASAGENDAFVIRLGADGSVQ